MKENRRDCLLLGGDFNGGIGERGARSLKERGEGREEKKIKRQGGKCRKEETDGTNKGTKKGNGPI
jgi:hypothetical protein